MAQIGKNECGLSATSGAAAALGVVGGRRGDVAQTDDFELGDVDTQLHRRRAEQHRELAGAKPLFAVQPLLVRDLGGVLAGLEAEQRQRRLCGRNRQSTGWSARPDSGRLGTAIGSWNAFVPSPATQTIAEAGTW